MLLKIDDILEIPNLPENSYFNIESLKVGSNNTHVKLDITNIYKENNDEKRDEGNKVDSDISSEPIQNKNMFSSITQELFYKLLVMFIIKPGLDIDENEASFKVVISQKIVITLFRHPKVYLR